MTMMYPFRSRRRYQSGGINQDCTWWVKCEAVGKAKNAEHPYMFANEWISGCIAQCLRLPIPPFTLMQKRSRSTAMFCSYSYRGDSTPSDVDPVALYRDHPEVCAGIVAFDILVLNCDRHGGNLKVDNPSAPKDFYIFDHERALFYIYPGEGIQRLRSRENRLGVTDGSDSGDEWHCLIDQLAHLEDLRLWITKIESIPNWFVEEICSEVLKLGIKRDECDAVIQFLKARRDGLRELIYGNRDRFVGINANEWGLFL